MKILFVCIANVNRSTTFEKWYNNNTKHECKSAGTHPYIGKQKVNKELMEWADKVCVMETDNWKWCRNHFWGYRHKLVNLNVPDIYEPDENALINIII